MIEIWFRTALGECSITPHPRRGAVALWGTTVREVNDRLESTKRGSSPTELLMSLPLLHARAVSSESS